MDFDRISRLYKKGSITKKGLENAVTLGCITKEQHDEIIMDKSADRIRFYVDYVKNGGSIDEVPEGVRREVEELT